VLRVAGERVTIELDLLIEEFSAMLEGYLTRVQLLDILCQEAETSRNTAETTVSVSRPRAA
jgi:hypothetical protein